MTLCLYTRTRIESYLTSSASCTHVQDNKDTIRSPKSSAILGPKKKKKSSIYKGKKKNKGKFFSFYPITQRSTPPALESSAFPTVLCYFPPHPPSLSTSGPSWHKLYSLALDRPLPFPLLFPSLVTSRIHLDLWLESWRFLSSLPLPRFFPSLFFFWLGPFAPLVRGEEKQEDRKTGTEQQQQQQGEEKQGEELQGS